FSSRRRVSLPKGNTAEQRAYKASNSRLAQDEWPCRGAIQMAIHPEKNFPRGCFTRRWIDLAGQHGVRSPYSEVWEGWKKPADPLVGLCEMMQETNPCRISMHS